MLGRRKEGNTVKQCPRCGRSDVQFDEHCVVKPICVECLAEMAREIARAEQLARYFQEQWQVSAE